MAAGDTSVGSTPNRRSPHRVRAERPRSSNIRRATTQIWRLTSRGRGLKSLGMSMLKNCRRFYRLYPHIRQSLLGQFAAISARALDNQLFVSRYLVALPWAEELRKSIENNRGAIESSMREPGS